MIHKSGCRHCLSVPLRSLTLALLAALSPSIGRADLPSIRFDRLSPLGAAAGSQAQVEVQGPDIEDLATLVFDRPGFTVEHVKDRTFTVKIADDVPSGTYDVRLSGRFGVSNPRLFAVSRGLTEVAEKEPNNDFSQSQLIEVNSIVNGVSDGNADDAFRFAAKKGQRVTLRCYAQKLASAMDATMALTTASGNPLAGDSDTFGSDPFIDFVAPNDGEFVVSISDLSYRGGFSYRLLVSVKPQLENVIPRAVQVGKPTELTFYGRNLGPESRESQWILSDLPLFERKSTLTAPPELLSKGQYRFLDHPTDHSVLPTAATCTLFGFQARPAELPEALDPCVVLATDAPVTLESEPNDDREKPQPITLPAVVSGRFDQPRDADWYEFETGDAGSYGFEVYSERIAGQADPYVAVMDDKGNRLNELDDFGSRINAFDGHLRDPSGSVNLQKQKKYRVLVQDRYQRGGPRYQYVLSIRSPSPDFYPAVIHHQNPGPGGTTLFRGGAQFLDVVLHYRDGFNGPVTITAEGLPPGMHAAPTTILGNTRGNFVLWADENAEPWTGVVKLKAVGTQDGVTLEREVRSHARANTDTGYNSSLPARELVVAIRETAPFSLAFAQDKVEVEAGQSAELKLNLKRLWPDFKDKMTLQPLALPGALKIANAEIGSGGSEGKMTVNVQANAKPGEYTIAVLGQAQVPFNKDPKATMRPNTLVALPSRPITIVVKEAPKK